MLSPAKHANADANVFCMRNFLCLYLLPKETLLAEGNALGGRETWSCVDTKCNPATLPVLKFSGFGSEALRPQLSLRLPMGPV
jgi:hypothetical protein